MFNIIKKIEKNPRFSLSINGANLSFNADYTLLQVCNSSGIYIPIFCYSEQVSIVGSCRICLVEVRGCPKPSVSCTSKIIPSMCAHTHSPMIKKVRESVLESLLLNHPLDCPVCDAGSECDLQNYSKSFGGESSRNELFLKRSVQDKNMGFFVKTIMSRCIHCSRCIRFLSDTALLDILGMVGRGEKAEISFYYEEFSDTSLLAGNIVDICPVGRFQKHRQNVTDKKKVKDGTMGWFGRILIFFRVKPSASFLKKCGLHPNFKSKSRLERMRAYRETPNSTMWWFEYIPIFFGVEPSTLAFIKLFPELYFSRFYQACGLGAKDKKKGKGGHSGPYTILQCCIVVFFTAILLLFFCVSYKLWLWNYKKKGEDKKEDEDKKKGKGGNSGPLLSLLDDFTAPYNIPLLFDDYIAPFFIVMFVISVIVFFLKKGGLSACFPGYPGFVKKCGLHPNLTFKSTEERIVDFVENPESTVWWFEWILIRLGVRPSTLVLIKLCPKLVVGSYFSRFCQACGLGAKDKKKGKGGHSGPYTILQCCIVVFFTAILLLFFCVSYKLWLWNYLKKYKNKKKDEDKKKGKGDDSEPKGALTHKDFAFKSRDWGVYYLPYSGMSDTLGLRLHLTVSESGLNNERNAVERTLPLFTDITRTKTLSDFTRYCNQGLKLDRIRWAMYYLKAFMNPAETTGFIYKDSLPIYNYGRFFAYVSGHYISFSKWYSLSSSETETGPFSTYNTSFARSFVYSLYPFLFSSSRWFYGSVTLSAMVSKAFFCSIKKACRDKKFSSVGVDFTSEFPPLICKILKNLLGYEHFKKAFFTGLMSYKIKDLLLRLKGSLNLLGLFDFLEGRSFVCKIVCKTLNFFIFISMLLKRRFDGSFLHFFANVIPLLKKNSGVLSYVPSEITCCWSFIEKSAVLKKLNTFNSTFSSYLPTYLGFYSLCLQSFNAAYIKVNRNILYLISEISDKANFISKNLLVISNIHWSSFNSRSTEKKSMAFFFKAVLPKKSFLIDGAFDFITTLARFIYNVKYYPTIITHYYRRAYIRILNEKKKGLCYSILVLDGEGGGASPSLVGFPLYFGRWHVYLTEIKSISKENIFRRDIFLKKSRELRRFIRNSVDIYFNNFI